jgi:CRP-like cAMP-binding protein
MTNVQAEFLAGLPPPEAEALLALGERATLAAGTVLFALGAVAERMFLIERGRVNLTLPMQLFGREEDVMVEERLPGQTVGWSALIPPHRFTLKATAQVETEVMAFPRAALVEHFAARPAVGLTVTRNVAAVIGQRLQVFQAMWLREMSRLIELRRA